MDYPRMCPMLAYDDAPAAIDFLCQAFGFEERFRLPGPGGTIGHAELVHGNGRDVLVMVATTWKAGGMSSPRDLPAVHTQLLCYVDDVDAHYARAKAAGATLVGEPEDTTHGDRSYRAVDPEGHRWIFASPIGT
jgi:PhnB protein